ncbi:hypothetical protein O1611_g10473 [Lasiodiplodia mahajangana]|uniref:Uncharacterized protein n=1 Tax=Lasiodiplodia mahajangana TaxID=1108764 RepID=A0ACC2IXR7_9PEZI|nr:hypothetical protein O1611_g10473 [Lasiodiplodia mahajangana]
MHEEHGCSQADYHGYRGGLEELDAEDEGGGKDEDCWPVEGDGQRVLSYGHTEEWRRGAFDGRGLSHQRLGAQVGLS